MFATNYTNFHELLGEKFVKIRVIRGNFMSLRRSFINCYKYSALMEQGRGSSCIHLFSSRIPTFIFQK